MGSPQHDNASKINSVKATIAKYRTVTVQPTTSQVISFLSYLFFYSSIPSHHFFFKIDLLADNPFTNHKRECPIMHRARTIGFHFIHRLRIF